MGRLVAAVGLALGGICDDPDRLAARLYVASRVPCGCCTFYRGFALGVVSGAALAIAGVALSRWLT